MKLERLLVLTGDHTLADPTKWYGGYSDVDLELHRIMVEALESLGRWRIEVCSEHAGLIDRLRADPPDLVMNFCDTGFRNVAAHELHVPALLEMLGVPYTGSPPQALALAYDKSLVALVADSIGVPVPRERVVPAGAELDLRGVAYPALVKPAQGDGSVGINRTAVVHDADALHRQLEWFRAELPGRTALVQEYLPGPEYGLALVGNPGSLRPFPMLEVDFSRLSAEVPPILAFESKTGPDNPYNDVGIVPARLDPEVMAELADRAGRLFQRIGCRDYARFDFRTAADGTIKLMEVNPNPAWSPEAKLAHMAGMDGIAYPQLLELLVDTAWTRTTAHR